MSRREVGLRGEQLAACHLEANGMVVLDRNWRGRDGELDIVALSGRTLVIAEVKTRTGDGFGPPAAAVTAKKYARLRRLAAQWLEEHAIRAAEVRIDVVSVRLSRAPEGGEALLASLDHIEGAFR